MRGVAAFAFAIVFYMNAYVCDDAFMIFRPVDNLLSGFGLTWNTDERVQTFTGPLYTLVLAVAYVPAWFTRAPFDPTGIYFTALIVGFVASLCGLRWFVRHCRDGAELFCGITLLLVSQAYVPFTSSGLETPLTLALAIVFFQVWFSDDLPSANRSKWLFTVASLGILNRLDSIVLFVPPLAWETIRCWRATGAIGTAKLATIATAPLLAWCIFSLSYYGLPLPTSYYAKVGSGVDPSVLWRMGLMYLQNSVQADPVTLCVFVFSGAAAIAAWLRRAPSGSEALLAWAGAASATVYITRVGGDFIGHRFLAAPFVVSVMTLIVCARSVGTWRQAGLSCIGVTAVIYALAWPSSPLRTPWDLPSNFDIKYYYRGSALLHYRLGDSFPLASFHSVRSAEHCTRLVLGERRVLAMGGGLRGFCSGPFAHTIDPLSITDPLIARLPSPPGLGMHTPGHIRKKLPEGYWESADSGENLIADPDLARFYADLRAAISGPLFTAARWKAIWRLNVKYGGRFRAPYATSSVPTPADNR